MRRLLKNPEVQTIQEEFDSARIYLARWAMGIAEQGERDRNNRIWTARDVLEMEETDVGEFELLDTEIAGLSLKEQRKTVTLKEWKSFFDPRTGRLSVTVEEVKERIFHGGLDADDGVRKEAWLFLLGVYEWDSTSDDRIAELASLRDEYVKLKGAWWDRLIDLGGEGEEGEWWREQKGRIDVGTNVHLEQMKDMLLTYNEYNRDLGYVQGMSDLLAPIYAVMQDDAVAFWGFQHFMERMERNFLRDQSGMRNQLLTLDHLVQLMDPKLYLHLQSADSTNFFFFFRMLLVWYKREFEWFDILRLWETLWTDYLSSNFHLFFALAILEKHRGVIMEHLKHFDEVLKYESTLIRAEALFRRFQRTVEAIDKKSNFPAPKLRQRKVEAPKSPTKSAEGATASTSGTDTVTSGSTNNGASSSTSPPPEDAGKGKQSPDKGKGKASPGAEASAGRELEEQKPKVISPELRALLSKKVEVLPRKVVRKEGEGLAKVVGKK
ncbi:putative GTPase-activating protein GYP7 [Glarea lozoyensis 74030]|uniref:Putative GTPase-activating protein GYP7 n=1 Tax=Glarea lozoyensis (strain ATCC 74030 / MF5533) TaxID=1104152 RepID=H0ECH6_GLAL7|nr:putative GTPase-activating protein GYP7 [Glarea lozoyensis 74030]